MRPAIGPSPTAGERLLPARGATSASGAKLSRRERSRLARSVGEPLSVEGREGEGGVRDDGAVVGVAVAQSAKTLVAD